MTEPMLCDKIEDHIKPLDFYLTDEDWWAEQKLDGHRVLMHVRDSMPQPFNRNGEPFRQKMSKQVLAEFTDASFNDEWMLDGELLNGHYHVFDMLMIYGTDLTGTKLYARRELLEALFTRWAPFHASLTGVVTTEHGKRDLLAKVAAISGEGVIFKHRDGLYFPGKRSHHNLKYKFVETGDVIVSEVWRQGKRSVGIKAYNPDGTEADLGACTMSEKNLTRVMVNDVIEVKYLYRGAQGHLFQPRFVRLRDDKRPQDCLTTQFKSVNKEVVA